MEILRVENLTASYNSGGNRFQVLKNVSLSVQSGDFIAIEGPSGSGKSTLFYILGCLLKPDEGKVYFDGQELTGLSTDELSYVRNQKIGFIFQQFHLLPRASILDNILLPTLYPCEIADSGPEDVQRAKKLAHTLGIGEKLDRSPNQLSGGQQQRVAIARALMKDVHLILADEPTGNLDSKSAAQIMDLLKELNQQGKTIILITHDAQVARQCKKTLRLRDGVFTEVIQDGSEAHPAKNAERFSMKETTSQTVGFKHGLFSFIQHHFKLATSVAPLAFENLRRNKMRAFLTMIGVTVGIASVLAMITFGQFVKAKILQGYQDLGVNTLSVWGGRNWRLRATDKVDVIFDFFDNDKDIKKLFEIFPDIVRSSPMLSSGTSTATFGGLDIDDDVWMAGVGSEYLALANREIARGRTISPYHVEHGDSVCLIGSEVVQKLFANVDPLGQIIFITQQDRPAYPCEVIGTLKPLSSNKDWMKPNLQILVPWTYYKSVHQMWESQIHHFYVQLREGSDVERMSNGLKAFLQQKYGPSGFFTIGNDAILLAQMRKFLTLFTLMLGVIALITLGVGGMGINNMMLVAISERLKEIGLRKAIGATDRSIRVQFLLESSLLCLISGFIGVVLGFSAYEAIIYATSKFVTNVTFDWVVDPIAMSVSIVSILVVGIASGIIPALKAERLQVIEALRNE